MRAFLIAGLAGVALPAAAQEAQSQPGRIWKGTLGDAAVTMCLDPAETGISAYYRDAELEPVRLAANDAATPLLLSEAPEAEEETSAVWTLKPVNSETMVGEWRKGDDALPIRLTAVAVTRPEYGSACESDAFIEPLLAGGTYNSTAERLGAASYTALGYAGPKRAGLEDYNFRTFIIPPVSIADEAINAALSATLPDGTVAHQMGQCAIGLLSLTGVPGYFEETLVPLLISPRWIALRQSGSSYCGGAHPNHFTGLAVYDRKTGAKADPSAWFRTGALMFYEWEPDPGQPRPIAGLSAALTKALLAQAPPREAGDECGDIVGEGVGWDIGLSREGPVFVPQLPHAIFACTEEVTLPWKAARRFLSPEGRAVMKSIR